MKSALTLTVFIVLFASFAQKDSIAVISSENPTEPLNSIKKDSIPKVIEEINHRYESILKKDELIEKKIAEIIKKEKKQNTALAKENKKLNKTIETKKNHIDSLETVIKEIESSVVLVDSVCVRWSFLTKHLDENCKEWKLILVK